MVNPAKCSSVIISGTPTDNQGVHSRKAKDNSITSKVTGSLPVTSPRVSTWSRTVSSSQRKSPGKNKMTWKWPSITRTRPKTLCGGVKLLINEASFTALPEMTCLIEQMEQLLGNLQLSDYSNGLDRYPWQVTADEVYHGHIIKNKVAVNNVPVNVLYDTGALMTCMAKRFFDTLLIKPKLTPCHRYIAGTEGEALRPVGKCFVQLQMGKRVFRDMVVVIKNLRHKYILGQVLHRSYWFATRYSTTVKHYITINGQVIAQAILQSIDYPILKTKGKVTLPPMSVSIIEVKTPKIP